MQVDIVRIPNLLLSRSCSICRSVRCSEPVLRVTRVGGICGAHQGMAFNSISVSPQAGGRGSMCWDAKTETQDASQPRAGISQRAHHWSSPFLNELTLLKIFLTSPPFFPFYCHLSAFALVLCSFRNFPSQVCHFFSIWS